MEEPNLSYINDLANGDNSFKDMLIEIVKNELPLEIEEYNNNIIGGNFNAVAENVHKLKHKISILGLEKSYYLAVDFEEEIKLENFSKREEFENILNRMSQFINEL